MASPRNEVSDGNAVAEVRPLSLNQVLLNWVGAHCTKGCAIEMMTLPTIITGKLLLAVPAYRNQLPTMSRIPATKTACFTPNLLMTHIAIGAMAMNASDPAVLSQLIVSILASKYSAADDESTENVTPSEPITVLMRVRVAKPKKRRLYKRYSGCLWRRPSSSMFAAKLSYCVLPL